MQRKVFTRELPISPNTSSDEAQTLGPDRLKLMMLSCENNSPYGPSENTANMFLDLIVRARARAHAVQQMKNDSKTKIAMPGSVSITVYECKDFDYPSNEIEWSSYSGIIIPGSFNSAYDELEWIQRLKKEIRENIHEYGRKTLAVCFGHQIFAHALDEGLARKCDAGPQTGSRTFLLTDAGKRILTSKCTLSDESFEANKVSLLYTHGDMVAKLPKCALSLGGNTHVPILSAAYFRSTEEVMKFEANFMNAVPYAVTFQAHPEYSSKVEYSPTFVNVVNAMCKRGSVSIEMKNKSLLEANEVADVVARDSIDAISLVCTMFNWL